MIIDTHGARMGYMKHKDYWGEQHKARVVDQLIEEMAELTKELMKARRGGDNKSEILRELCDVLLCLEYLGQDEGFTNEIVRPIVTDLSLEVESRLTYFPEKYGRRLP
jgi:NTP pyrophosphatase (non-canonical NTP hydrolase)